MGRDTHRRPRCRLPGHRRGDEGLRRLVELVKAKQVSIEGVILVTHAEDGSVTVQRTRDNLGRKGMGWGGGVGVAVGLFAPPMLASVAVGAVAGRVMGRFAGNKVNKELHDKIGENLPPVLAGIIAIFGMMSSGSVSSRRSRARCSARLSRATRRAWVH